MQEPAALAPEEHRFFDGGDDDEAPDEGKPPQFVFVRIDVDGRERFQMTRRIGYRTRPRDAFPSRVFIVPRDLRNWTTDFASVPWVFAWLVPRSGNHLPAALIHDAMVARSPNYIGPDVSRDEADLIFKEAMADLDTGVVRRWLIWTAVTLGTIFSGQLPGQATRWYYVAAASVTLGLTVWLGAQATLDLLDACGHCPGVIELPWMRAADPWRDLAQGAAGALVVPALLGLLWGRFWRAGVIAGTAVAVLLHVTAIVLVLTGLYLALERLGRWNRGRGLLVLLLALGIVAAVVFVRSVR